MRDENGCIYCGEKSDLSISDIIPDALTNGKICNRNVCRINHNNRFSDAFEYEIIQGLAAITNALNIKSSKCKSYAQYQTEIIVDGTTYDAKISSEVELFHRERILKSRDGKHFLGPLDKLSQFNDSKIKNVSRVDINEIGIEKRITVDLEIFFSDSMYRLIAKIAFEWYCMCNDIHNKCEELDHIIQYITEGSGANPVHILCSKEEHVMNTLVGEKGNHTLISYVPEDGSLNILISLFGIAIYNVKMSETVPENCKYEVNYFSVDLDGKRIEFKAKTASDLYDEIGKQMMPMDNIGDFQLLIPKNMKDDTITAKMFYTSSAWFQKGTGYDTNEIEIRKELKRNIDYIMNKSPFTVHSLKRFAKDYKEVIDRGVKINKKAVVTKTLFLFYVLFTIGQENSGISCFEEINNQIVKKFGKREIALSYDVCMKMQEEIISTLNYADIIKRGAKVVLEM